jgi:hypothetical protein
MLTYADTDVALAVLARAPRQTQRQTQRQKQRQRNRQRQRQREREREREKRREKHLATYALVPFCYFNALWRFVIFYYGRVVEPHARG